MRNNHDTRHLVARAMVAGALAGSASACIEQWRQYQRGDTSLNQAATHVACNALRASAASGAVMALANASAHRPLLSVLTVAGAGVASLYLLDALTKKAR